jgi:predicted DNA-binding transcriptional regulator YafY
MLPDDEWVDAMILGYGDMVEVLEPESVRERITVMVGRLQELYRAR